MSEPMHVDQFIDSRKSDAYASWFLNMKRLPATLQFKFEDQIKQYKLFCDFEGWRYRVTGCSRMGDVWLTTNFEQETGYERRVLVEKCSNWGPEQ